MAGGAWWHEINATGTDTSIYGLVLVGAALRHKPFCREFRASHILLGGRHRGGRLEAAMRILGDAERLTTVW